MDPRCRSTLRPTRAVALPGVEFRKCGKGFDGGEIS